MFTAVHRGVFAVQSANFNQKFSRPVRRTEASLVHLPLILEIDLDNIAMDGHPPAQFAQFPLWRLHRLRPKGYFSFHDDIGTSQDRHSYQSAASTTVSLSEGAKHNEHCRAYRLPDSFVLMFEDRRMQVCTKLGHVVWPQSPWRKGKPEHVREFTMTLSDFNAHWIRGIGLAHDAFHDVIAAARVIDPEDIDRKT